MYTNLSLIEPLGQYLKNVAGGLRMASTCTRSIIGRLLNIADCDVVLVVVSLLGAEVSEDVAAPSNDGVTQGH